jgi:hypothetical protein
MTQEILWANLFFGYFFIIGEQYVLGLSAFIILCLLFGGIIKRFLDQY